MVLAGVSVPLGRARAFALLLFSLIFILASHGYCETVPARVLVVLDGDTVLLELDGVKRHRKCRLYGIDAPELEKDDRPGQPFAPESKDFLKKLVEGKRVGVTFTGGKSYGRDICVISLGGVDVNREVILQGYAWAYRRFLVPPFRDAYIAAENEARSRKRGLWSQRAPMSPGLFKKRYWHGQEQPGR